MSTAEVMQLPVLQGEGGQIIQRTPMDMLNMAVARGDAALAEKLMDLSDRWEANQARKEFDAAMAKAQAEMHVVITDKPNTQTKSRYASYAALDRELRPIYTKYGFDISYDTEPVGPEVVRIFCIVSRGGHSRRHKIDLPADGKGAKGGDVMTKTHAAMSCLTYGKRGTLGMAFNIAVGEVDDDGNGAAGAVPAITQDQADKIREALEANGKSRDAFLKWAKVERIEDIRASAYESCIAAANFKPGAK